MCEGKTYEGSYGVGKIDEHRKRVRSDGLGECCVSGCAAIRRSANVQAGGGCGGEGGI